MKQDDYIVIQGWMVSELGLKGNELIIFALVHGFCKDGKHEFTGSISYIKEWTNISERTVITILQRLVCEKLLNKEERFVNNVKVCAYSLGTEKISGVLKKFQGGTEKISGDNTINNIIPIGKDLINKNKKEIRKEKFDVYADLSYVDAEYQDVWIEWLNYKDKIGKQYKTDIGVVKAYKHFLNLANGDVGKAKAIVDQSIMREYEGLFDVKDYKSAEMNIDEQARKEGFPYKDENGKHYETMYDRYRYQNSYEDYIKNRT